MTPGSIRCIFLDRDGVINVKLPQQQWVTTPDALELTPGATSAIATLNAKMIRVVVVTNQRGIALGLFSEINLSEVHQRLRALLAAEGAYLDAIYYCPHDRNLCDCRKPQSGMFRQAFDAFPEASPANSLMVGDSLSDIEAGRKLEMETVFIEGDPRTKDPGAAEAKSLATYTASSLAEFVNAWFPS